MAPRFGLAAPICAVFPYVKGLFPGKMRRMDSAGRAARFSGTIGTLLYYPVHQITPLIYLSTFEFCLYGLAVIGR